MTDTNETKKTRKPRPTHDEQFKRDAVKLLSQPGYTLAKAAQALGVSQTALRGSRNGFYDYARRVNTLGPRARRRAELAEKITQVHDNSRGIYGSPRIHRQLRDDGEVVTEKTVAKVMKTLSIQGKSPRPRKPRTTNSDHGRPVADNLLERDFTATGPNQKWVSDITYIDTELPPE